MCMSLHIYIYIYFGIMELEWKLPLKYIGGLYIGIREKNMETAISGSGCEACFCVSARPWVQNMSEL